MKKFLYPLLALGAIATLASCASDEPINVKEYDGTARFSIRLPDELATRFNDGESANKLYYSVFQDGEYVLDGVITDAFSNNLTQEVGIQLVANQEYQIVFFADNATSETKGYTYNPKTADFGVTYSNKMVNSDDFDAFVNTITYTATGEGTDVPLKRPFAQLNIGTNDLDNGAVTHIGLDKFSSTLTIQPTNILSGINFLSGNETAYSGEALSFSITSFASLPADAFPVDNYKYIEMNYLLVPATGEGQNSLIDATYVIEANSTTGNTLNLASTPVKTNYQTNVYGSLLTTQNKFNVEIKPAFDGELDKLVWDGSTVEPEIVDNVMTINTPAQFAGMAKMVNEGNKLRGVKVVLAADIDLGNVKWNPIGQLWYNTEFAGEFDGQNHTVYNLYVDYNDNSPEDCAGLFGKVNGNIRNLNIRDFSVTGSHYTGALIGYDTNGVDHIVNCHAYNGTVTSIPNQPNGPEGGYDNGDKVGGLIGMINAAEVSGCSVSDVTVTGFRGVGGLIGYSYSDITKCSVSNATVMLSNKNYYNKTERPIGEIIGQGAGKATDCTATNVTIIKDGTLVSTPQEFVEALSNVTKYNQGIVLTADLDMTGVAVTPITNCRGLVLNGNGHKISNMAIKGTANNLGLVGTAISCTAKDITFNGCSVEGNVNYAGLLFGTTYGTTTLQNVTFNGCSLKAGKKLGIAVGFAAENPVNMTNVAVNNCTITSTATAADDEAGQVGAVMGYLNDTATFTNCTVSGCTLTINYKAETWQDYASGKFLGVYGNRGGNAVAINFNNCKVSNTTLVAPGNATYQNLLNGVGDRLWGVVRSTTGPGKIFVNGVQQSF